MGGFSCIPHSSSYRCVEAESIKMSMSRLQDCTFQKNVNLWCSQKRVCRWLWCSLATLITFVPTGHQYKMTVLPDIATVFSLTWNVMPCRYKRLQPFNQMQREPISTGCSCLWTIGFWRRSVGSGGVLPPSNKCPLSWNRTTETHILSKVIWPPFLIFTL